jgi:RNA polymerase sigma factor (sigma-70 family)
MRDARDAEDKRLLETGEIDLLLSGWVETIRGRSIARMRGPVGEDVAQAVCERLWRELKAGKHRDGRLPFRVVVHSVIGWVCKGWNEPGWRENELLDLDGAAPEEIDTVVVDLTLEQFVATLPPGDGELAALYYLEGLEPREIAARLDKKPNAVYQAISRNKEKLREWLEE